MEQMDSVKIPEVSTADPLKQDKNSSSLNFISIILFVHKL